MKEFMLYIRNSGEGKSGMDAGTHLAFVKKCEHYIDKLKANGNLIAAQPIMRDGIIIIKKDGSWSEQQADDSASFQVGYYHLYANDLNHAIELAKENPEFEYVNGASIEIRQIKTKEEKTAFVYPKGK